jgi:hypothetical protein
MYDSVDRVCKMTGIMGRGLEDVAILTKLRVRDIRLLVLNDYAVTRNVVARTNAILSRTYFRLRPPLRLTETVAAL